MNSIVIHYKELALKGRNRPWFIQRLVRNLRVALADLGVRSVRSMMGRIEIDLPTYAEASVGKPASAEASAGKPGFAEGSAGKPGFAEASAGPSTALRAGRPAPATWEELRDRIQCVFGIANFSHAGRAPHDFDALAAAILGDLGDTEPRSFRVSARRADKRLPFTSPDIEREVGGRIKEARGWHVDLSHPELTINIEMLPEYAFYFLGKHPGAGGLPTGTGGRVACLLSGGIDSPVAAYRLMRRGCSVLLIHFHSYPILSRASQEKVREIATLLTKYQLRSRLMLVPFGSLQQQVVLAVPPELRVVIYRRLMFRIAEKLARQWRARALVTGEVIGQVASQTLENLTTIAEATTMEVLRPLVGMDKDEIVASAERLGTFPISIIPDQDCCQLFTPRHPATRARRAEVEQAESVLPIQEMVDAAAAATIFEDFSFPAGTRTLALAGPSKTES